MYVISYLVQCVLSILSAPYLYMSLLSIPPLSSAVSSSQREEDKSSFAEATKIMYLCSCFIYCIIKSL